MGSSIAGSNLSFVLFVTALLLPLFAHAQAVPDAGSLRQQIERERQQPPLPEKASPLKGAAPAPLALAPGQTVQVNDYRFAGNLLLGDVQLQPVVQPFVGRIGFGGLTQAAQAVANAYRDAGWIVRAYLPEQDVTEGTVTIQVVEARFAGARIQAGGTSRVAERVVLASVGAQQAVGAPLSAAALDRALLLADDLPGVAVAGTLEPGASDGETALALDLRAEPTVSGEVSVDNAGSRSTGSTRAVANAGWTSPLARGDLARADLLKTSGSHYARLAYSLPVEVQGMHGMRVGVNASRLNYKLVGDEFEALNGRGNSTSTGVDASYPLLRGRTRNVYVSAAYDAKRFVNQANGAMQSRYRVEAFTLGVSGNVYDTLGGGGSTNLGLALQTGTISQGSLDVGENPALAGRINKLRYNASRQQVLSSQFVLAASLNGQVARRDFDSSERFYLGGPGGVRAYPANEAGGSSGHLLNLELRWRPNDAVVLTAFHDSGRVRNYSAGSLSYSLKGHGLALNWQAPRGVSVKVTWAAREGRNPNPTATGRDQDGSLVRNRVWVGVTLPFELGAPAARARY